MWILNKVLTDITGLSGVHGTAFAGGKAYISEGGANEVAVVDSKKSLPEGIGNRGRHQAGRRFCAILLQTRFHLQRHQQ